MRKSKVALLLSAIIIASCSNAETSTSSKDSAKASALTPATAEANIRAGLKRHLPEGMTIDGVQKSPYSGLYEVRAAGNILYADETGQFMIVGRVIDTASGEDLTRVRTDEINKIKFSDLPLESAVKVVKGDGKRVIAIFEDPNCGYCKKFRQTTLKETNNVTVYTFMYNILAEDSSVKAKNIWCAPNRSKAWEDWMIAGVPAPDAPLNCETPNDKVLALGQKLHLNATPSIFFADGTRVVSAIDATALEAKFATVK